MAESTLSLGYNDLAGEVGLFLGYGRGAANGDAAWSVQQQAVIDSCVRSGQRQFYVPPPIEGETSSYDWSFLKPVATLDFPPNAATVPLPDDYAGLEGQITLQAATGTFWWSLDLTGIGRVYHQYAMYPTTTGRPQMAAEEPIKGTGALQGQRFQLHIWPLADADYKITFAYYVNPDRIDPAFPYAYGGMTHAETILESCLAIAEQKLDDSLTVHSTKFRERLLASISVDRKFKPQKFGYNADRSDRRHWRPHDQHGDSLVTVRGVQY